MRTASGVGLGVVLVLLAGAPAPGQKSDKKGDKDVVVAGKKITEWIKSLQSKEILPRMQAINALRQAGPEARRAVPALIGVFRDKDATFLHALAALTLARIGADAVSPLEKALKDDAVTVRGGAAFTLGYMGVSARPAVPALTAALKDPEAFVRSSAAQALGRLGRLARAAAPGLRAALADKDDDVRVDAAVALWEVAGETRGVPVLAAALKQEGPTARTAAAVLGDIGPGAKIAVPALKESLGAKSLPLRIVACKALYRVSKDAEAALPVLEKLLTTKEAGERLLAAAALGTLGPEAKAVTLLVELLKSKDTAMRREAACALAERGVALEKAVPALEAGLHDPDREVRWWCALALAASEGGVGKKEEDIVRIFRSALFRTGDREPGKEIQELQAMGSARAAPALASVLRSRPARLRVEAARSLKQLGPDARPAQAALIEALPSDDKGVRRAAAEALGQLGPEVLPALKRLLGNADGRVREGAARALGQMGLQARSAVDALLRLEKDADSAVRMQVALALWKIDARVEVLGMLKLVLVDVDNKDRWEAIEALGVISVEARPAIRGLIEVMVTALKDRDPRVRTHAARWIFRRERQPKVVVPLLRDAATDRDVFVRISTVETLGELGAAARVVPLLTKALEDRDLSVRLAAEESLARGGVESVPQLTEALKNESTKVRLGVVRALGLMGPRAKGAVTALEGLKRDKDATVRQAAAEALREIGR